MKTGKIFCIAVLLVSTQLFAGDRDAAMVMVNAAEKKFAEADYATAQSMAERALAEDKECPEAHFLIARCLAELGKTKEAMASFQTAVELARKAGNIGLANKATEAAKKLAPGLIDI